jgi:hypothetical protein
MRPLALLRGAAAVADIESATNRRQQREVCCFMVVSRVRAFDSDAIRDRKVLL